VKYNDSFIVKNASFSGKLFGYGGINSLVFSGFVKNQIFIDIPNMYFETGGNRKTEFRGIQIINGRNGFKRKIDCRL